MRIILSIAFLALLTAACQAPEAPTEASDEAAPGTSLEAPTDDRQLILQTLENETRYFCERDLENWRAQWSHADFVSKMYAGETDFEYLDDWAEIDAFTVNHMENEPDKIPIPELDFDYEIHLFGTTAWVFYAKRVDGKSVRETRFMVQEEGLWKIGRMQTIY